MIEQTKQPAPLKNHALKGMGIAVVLLVLAFAFLGRPNTGSNRWMVLPSILVPLAGAFGGMVFYVTDPLRLKGGWRRTVADILSYMLYLFIVAAAFCIAVIGPD